MQKYYLRVTDSATKLKQHYQLDSGLFGIGFSGYGNDLGFDASICGRVRDRSIGGKKGMLPQLSREHCSITPGRDGRYLLCDMGSRTGTYLNGKRISKKRECGFEALNSGDKIGLIPDGLKYMIEMEFIAIDEALGD